MTDSSTTCRVEVRAFNQTLKLDISRSAAREAATHWLYVLRQRRRWARGGVLSDDLQKQVDFTLGWLGFSREALESFTFKKVIEISLPFDDETRDWEVRVLPWEFLLREALRGSHPHRLVIVRHLREATPPVRTQSAETERPLLAMVESSPEPIESLFAFDFERRLVASSLGIAGSEADDLTFFDPDPKKLKDWLAPRTPRVVHVTGVDTREGADILFDRDPETAEALLPEGWKPRSPGDGMLIRSEGRLRHMSYIALGKLVGEVAPEIAIFNFYRTGLRLAAQTVKCGADAAIGFLDSFDDALAEVFLSAFYQSWIERNDAHLAFLEAWRELDAHPQRRTLKGTGIVLWTRHAAFREGNSLDVQVEGAPKTLPKASALPARAQLSPPDIQPLRALNYSLMHNDRGVFRRFRLALKPGHELRGVSVEVALHAGSERAEYRTSVDLSAVPIELASRIHLPLTAPLARLADERIVSSIFVRVAHRNQVLHTDSYRVSLLPIDEWRDDDRDRQWLPCFVLPRDPAIPRLIGHAQRYLRTLDDDTGAAFDGYQRGETDHLDNQVAGIWNALLHEFPIDYANPPPTYTASSQRIRTPRDLMHLRQGTCIDLSLLLAAALEHVDIYPVLVLMHGHACVGYWRSVEKRRAFHARPYTPPTVETGRSVIGDDRAPPWVSGRNAYFEVRELVRSGSIVPIESTWLPQRRGFEAAVLAGMSNIESQADFDAMIDVVTAREDQVTPLPFTWRGPDGQHA